MTTPLNTLTDTWNSGGTLYGLKYNITNTASGVGSRLVEFQVGGSSRFNIDVSGTAFFGNTTSSLSLNNSATDPAFISNTGSILFTGGTVTANKPVINATQEWNSGAITFSGLKLNITNTASAAGSLLMDLQVGGASKFNVDVFGNTVLPNNTQFAWGNAGNYILGHSGLFTIVFGVNAHDVASFSRGTGAIIGGLSFGASAYLAWSPTSNTGDTPDILLYRDDAGVLAQRVTTSPQTLRVYNTFTDSSNYERGVFDWTTTANTLTIGTQGAGTGSARNLSIVGGVISITTGASADLNFNVHGVGAQFSAASGSILYIDQIGFNYMTGDTILARGAAGVFKFASSQSFSANTTVATVLGSLGPTGANTTVQEWLTIKNASGTTRYIPCF